MNWKSNLPKLIRGRSVLVVRTLFLVYKNIFYKNIEAEICEILRIF